MERRLTALRLLKKMGDANAAGMLEASLRKSARVNSEALRMLVGYYHRGGQVADAESILRQAREARPRRVGTLSLFAHLLAQLKSYDDAEAALREALVLEPESPRLLNELAYMNADRGVKVEEALTLIDRALKKFPDSASLQDTRGWALFRLKRLAEAEDCLRKAASKAENAVILDHLADVLQARGANREALEAWKRAVAQLPVGAELRIAIEKKVEAAKES
jgi:tetratricopeptide (TPR) repeat protein